MCAGRWPIHRTWLQMHLKRVSQNSRHSGGRTRYRTICNGVSIFGGIETTYTNNTTANILLRTTGVKNAGVTYASTVGTAIRDYETTTATAREQYLSTLMSIGETAAEATMRADRDKKIALADADLQKQLNGNESAHTTAVNNANRAHSTATANAEPLARVPSKPR